MVESLADLDPDIAGRGHVARGSGPRACALAYAARMAGPAPPRPRPPAPSTNAEEARAAVQALVQPSHAAEVAQVVEAAIAYAPESLAAWLAEARSALVQAEDGA